jgi:ribosomal protein L32
MFEYEGVRRVVYGQGATFCPVCPNCGRFVRADETITLKGDGLAPGPTATCKKCGRIEMPFEGFI